MFLIYGITFSLSVKINNENTDKLLINDVTYLYPTHVKKVVEENQTSSLVEIIKNAKLNNLTVSIAGRQHSQGGHTYYKDSVFIDMKFYNQILNLDVNNKIITVQSGVTWEQIQNHINPYNLSIKIMQSSNIFTIGGSMSSNVHGRDPSYGPIIETIISFRLLIENGTIVNVDRNQNSDLFYNVIGGYGLFGIILDVDIELTENEVYVKKTQIMDYSEYTKYIKENVDGNSEIGLHYGRLSISPDETFLKETSITDYIKVENYSEEILELEKEKNIFRDKFFFGLSRNFDWGKKLRWYLQKKVVDSSNEIQLISRNNAMRPPIKFLEYHSSKDTDILQEYFIPKENFVNFIDGLRSIIENQGVNLLSVTLRDLSESKEATISYSKKDSISVALYINQGISNDEKEKASTWTQNMVDLAIENDGTYYLTYQLYPSQEQIRTVYPNIDDFFLEKKRIDPQEIFMNKFYAKYALGEEDEN